MLGSRGVAGVVFEADSQVGGIAKTVEHDGFRFDLGGHRFFTKVPWVQEMWEETLGDEFLTPARGSRASTTAATTSPTRSAPRTSSARLGVVETIRCLGSYLSAAGCAAPSRRRRSRSGSPARFGRRLYDAFFREYTEKVWGIPGSEIQAEWAAQRIRNLSFWTALTSRRSAASAHTSRA